jgi:hypothetical protein
MRLLPLVLSLAAATATASAQTTWHNLHFGESRDDVTNQLTNQNMPSTSTQDGNLQANSDYDLYLPGLRYPLPMIVTVHFDDHAALTDITLALNLTSARRSLPSTPSTSSDDALLHFAAEHFTAALSGRYGPPLYSSNSCDTEAKQASTFCIVSWRTADQTIELERTITLKGPRLLIRYQPLATDL